MSKLHVEASLAKIRVIFEKAAERIDALKPGEKIPATALATEIAKEHGMTCPQLYPTLKFLFDGYPGVDVRKGAHGGIIKLDPNAPVAVTADPTQVSGQDTPDPSV
jgi:hypothetical protein